MEYNIALKQKQPVDARLKAGSSTVVAGPSGSGKTHFVAKIIKHSQVLYDKPPKRLVYIYGIYQDKFMNMQKEFAGVNASESLLIKNFAGDETIKLLKPHDLLVVDDLMAEVAESQAFTSLFTKYCHHMPLTLIYITQNFFSSSSKLARSRSLSSQYVVLMKNVRDASVIQHIGRQVMPGNTRVLANIYKDATRDNAYSYLMMDFHQETPSYLRFRTGIFPDEKNVVYIPLNTSKN